MSGEGSGHFRGNLKARLLVVLAIAALTFLIAGCGLGSTVASTGTVRGFVYYNSQPDGSQSGGGTPIPIAGAIVELGGFRKETDQNGAFVISGVPARTQRLEVSATGYAPFSMLMPVRPADQTVTIYLRLSNTTTVEFPGGSSAQIQSIAFGPQDTVVTVAGPRYLALGDNPDFSVTLSASSGRGLAVRPRGKPVLPPGKLMIESARRVKPRLYRQPEMDAAVRRLSREALDRVGRIRPQMLQRVEVSPAPRYNVGDRRTFYVIKDFSGGVFAQVSATVEVVGNTCYVFVDDNAGFSSARAQMLASEFDSGVWGTNHANFGYELSPNNPWDADGDPRVCILVTPLPDGVGGYYYPADELPNVPDNPYSNETEIVYLNGNLSDDRLLASVLAHEFQHMIFFGEKVRSGRSFDKDDTWFNEGLSMLAMVLNDYSDPSAEGDIMFPYLYARDPYTYDPIGYFTMPESTSLTYWGNGTLANYGASYLFVQYLRDHFGPSALLGLIKSKDYVIDAFPSVIYKTFDEVYRNWTIANFFSDSRLDLPPDHSYSSIRLLYYPAYNVVGVGQSGGGNVKGYAVRYFVTESGDGSDLTLRLSGTGFVTFEGTAVRFGSLIP
ncbi:MAG TPA: carboxypeptidase regulatory-like domain-containing protein [Firmicutes bacterium]|nr:carboxypeptidase regulatory-like domain-containing protein [Bacillota bacterium]